MRILLYDNTQMICKSGRFYCANGTGKFAQELVELGNEVTMFGQQVADSSSTSTYDIIAGGIRVAGLGRYKSKIISYILLYFVSLGYIIKSDFVYFFYPTSYCYLPFFCRFFGKKYGLYVRGEVDVDNRLSRVLYRNAFAVFTVAQSFTDMVNAETSKKVAYTIRPMISYTNEDVIRDRKYSEKDRYELLFLSRVQKEKGVRELLYAVKRLLVKGKLNFHLTLIGGGGYFESVSKMIKELDLVEFVTLTGPVNNDEKKKQYFLESDIYILPSYNEGFPRTLYEAMIFGTPIITTFVGGVKSLMVDGVNCKRIEVSSEESIEEVLSYALSNYNEMGLLAKNATQTVLKVVDPKRLSHAQDVNRVIHGLKT